jgi:hypothetical protein
MGGGGQPGTIGLKQHDPAFSKLLRQNGLLEFEPQLAAIQVTAIQQSKPAGADDWRSSNCPCRRCH